MIGRNWLACLLLCIALPVHAQASAQTPAEAAGDEAAGAAHRAYLARLVPALVESGQARALAYAALLRDIEATAASEGEAEPAPDPQAREWRRTAFARAGADPIALILLIAGRDGEDGVRAEALARWRQIEPNNLMPWLSDATATAQQVLEASRTATRANSHAYAQLRWLLETHREHPTTAAEAARLHDGRDGRASSLDGYVAIHGMATLVAAAWVPGFQPVIGFCRETAAQAPHSVQAQDCRKVGELLRDGDTRMDQMMGLVLSDAMARNAVERRELAEARRRFDWQMYEWGRLSSAAPAGGIDDFVRLLADPTVDSEQTLVERLLTEAGVPLVPPARWQPPRR